MHGKLLNYLKNNFSIEIIAKEKKCTAGNIRKRLAILIKHRYLKKNTNIRGVVNEYTFTSKGSMALEKYIGLSSKVQSLEELKTEKNIIRYHNITFGFPLILKKKQLQNINNKLIKLNIFSEQNIKSERGMTNWYQTFYKTTEVQIRTTSRSLIIRLPGEYFARTPEDAINQAVDDLTHNIISKIENWFNIKLGKHNIVTADILTQHFAIANSELAKQCIDAGFTNIKLKDKNNQTRWTIDNSTTKDQWNRIIKLCEEECVHKIHAPEDVKRIKENMSHIIFDKVNIKENRDNINANKNAIIKSDKKIKENKEEVKNVNDTLILMTNTMQTMDNNIQTMHQYHAIQTKQTLETMKVYDAGISRHMGMVDGIAVMAERLEKNSTEMKQMIGGVKEIMKGLNKLIGANKTTSKKKFKKKNKERNKHKKKFKRKRKKRY